MLTSQKQKMAALAAVETQLASFCDCKGDLGAGPPGLARTQAHVNRTEPLIARLLRTADDDAPSAFRNADVAIDSVYYDGDLDCGRRVVNRAFEHEGDDEWFGAEIGEADVMRDVVVCELVAAISRTYDQLALGVRHVRDVEVDVLHAGAQAALARAKLARARKDTVTDVVVLLRLRQRRERYAAVVDVAKRCVAAKQALEEIYDAAADGDLSRAVELTWDASVALRDKDLKDLRVLDGARRRTDGVVPTLRAAVDHALRRCIDDEE
ncbi:hypothetical protein M885DRAFT_7589 [Pelagophyceae sp. CCMP2097]|nr:hypothetical protein M885DRAFT_7589 [Pelagophyceae sp. CCMP2097]